MRVLLGAWVVVAAWWVTGAMGEPGTKSPVMGDLYWCTTLCMCHAGTQNQVQCFTRRQVYRLVGFNDVMVMRMERADWRPEEKTRWCNDLCLCYSHNNAKFQCTDENTLGTLLDETVGDNRWLAAKRDLAEAEVEVDDLVAANDDFVTEQVEEELEVVDQDLVAANDDPMVEGTEDKEVTAEANQRRRSKDRKRNKKQKKHKKQKQMEAERHQHDFIDTTHTTPQAMQISEAPISTTMTATTTATPDVAGEDVELLPEVSAVREVPVERKTVASEVSQDLDELGSAVLQIRSDVVFNQRILLVTVAVAGIAMLGVLVLAVHSCARRRQEANEEHQGGGRDGAKEDHHVTKINREEEW